MKILPERLSFNFSERSQKGARGILFFRYISVPMRTPIFRTNGWFLLHDSAVSHNAESLKRFLSEQTIFFSQKIPEVVAPKDKFPYSTEAEGAWSFLTFSNSSKI